MAPRKVILFLCPYALESAVSKWRSSLAVALRAWCGQRVRMVDCVPPFEDETPGDPRPFWFRPYATTSDARRKLLRKQIFAGIVSILQMVARHRPSVIVRSEQGGLMAYSVRSNCPEWRVARAPHICPAAAACNDLQPSGTSCRGNARLRTWATRVLSSPRRATRVCRL